MNLKEKLLTLPKKPGCYLHKDKNGTVIYVGKAINLFNRVNSYFRGAHDYKTTKLVSNIVDFDYIVTKSEKEALILEYNLIKEYDPKYNIVFKDDKSYPYILLKETKEPFVSVVRLKKKSRYKGRLFGPYPDVFAARNVYELINKLYLTRKCENLQKDYCLYYHIKQCPGYCKNDVSNEECQTIKEEIISFLNGDYNAITKNLKVKMNKCVEDLNYEQAAYYRDLIADINKSLLKQNVQTSYKETFDVWNYACLDGYIAITGLFIKKGKLLSTDKYMDYLVGDPENFVTSYIYQYYQINERSKNIYLPSELLTYFDANKVSKGYKYQMLKQAKLNSEENLKQNRMIITKKDEYIEQISAEFSRIFNKEIHTIELFDNSHTAGSNTVGAMVCYKDFKKAKDNYRLFKLEEGGDDLASMKEMLYRRYFRVLKDGLPQPDLIIVDGGRIQIEAAKEILNNLDMHIALAGLGKDDHHNTSYLMDTEFNMIEVKKNSDLFFFLTTMQDEVHRFAITYHRKLRQKSTYKSILDDIKGLGPKSRLKLLKKYKSIEEIRNATIDDLSVIIPKKVASELYNKLRENV